MNAPLNRTKYGKGFDENYDRIFRVSTMPMIEDKEVAQDDLGRNITYIPNHAPADPKQWERGVLSSFNETGVWVRFKGPNGEKCDTRNLRWG